MQFILTDLQKEIKENAEKLLSEQIDLLETIKKVDEDNRLDVELWKLVNEQGWLALDVPEEDGGLGFSTHHSPHHDSRAHARHRPRLPARSHSLRVFE